MKLMKTQDAVGQVLCHDITQIIKGVTKDAVFRKGHVITEEDIPVLLSVGKDNVYIWEKGEKKLHENEAAEILREMCQGEYMHPTPVKEGKIELVADIDGLLKVNSDKIKKVNSMGEMMIASRHGNFAVKKGDKLAGTRIIPLVIEKEKMESAKAVCEGQTILSLKPFVHKKGDKCDHSPLTTLPPHSDHKIFIAIFSCQHYYTLNFRKSKHFIFFVFWVKNVLFYLV